MSRTANTYIVTRYSLIPDNQMTLNFDQKEYTKEEKFLHWIQSFQTTTKQPVSLKGKKTFIFYCKKISDSRYLLKFGKHTTQSLTIPTENDFESIQTDDYLPSTILVDITEQYFLIQHNTSLFQEVESLTTTVSECITEFLKIYGIIFKLDVLTEEHHFWDYLETYSQNLQYIEFTFNSPNFLSGLKSVSELLNKTKEEFNNESFTVKVENKNGNLIPPKKTAFFKDAVKYVSAGCGKWKIKPKASKSLSSGEVAIKKQLSNNITSLTDESIQEIDSVFKSIEHLNKERIKGSEDDERNNDFF